MEYHKAIIKRNIYKKDIQIVKRISGKSETYYVDSKWNMLGTDEVWKGDLYSPLLTVNEKIFVSNLNETLTVKEVTRTTNNEYIYLTNPLFIEDKDILEKATKLQKEADKLNKEFQEEKMNWFQRIFKRKNIG